MKIHFFPGIPESQVMSVTVMATSREQLVVKDAWKLSQQNLTRLLVTAGWVRL